LELPADAVEEIALADLPVGWDQRPYPDAVPQFLLPRLQSTDAAWAFSVPSVVLPGSPTRNVLINPLHPRAGEVRVAGHRSLVFDERLRPAAPAAPARNRRLPTGPKA
jgi:hypothetical protein